MPVTMSDIARAVNVSVVTVSKVLRGEGRISEATRTKVLRRAKEMNYQPNLVARSLVTRRTFTIGLVLPEFTHSFFAEVARAITETVRPHGYHVVIACFEEDAELETSEVDAMLARQVDGLVIASAQPPGSACVFQRILQRKVPLVLIDRPIAGVAASFVGVDNRAIGKVATEHLIGLGRERIAHLRGPKFGIGEARLSGYCQALAKHGKRAHTQYVVCGGHTDCSGYDGMRELLAVSPRPDAVFCFNDPVAVGALKAILEAGLKVPEDIAVLGAGNIRYSDVLAVPLTTVDQETSRMGVVAGELLMARIGAKKALRPERILIPPKLVERHSTRIGMEIH